MGSRGAKVYDAWMGPQHRKSQYNWFERAHSQESTDVFRPVPSFSKIVTDIAIYKYRGWYMSGTHTTRLQAKPRPIRLGDLLVFAVSHSRRERIISLLIPSRARLARFPKQSKTNRSGRSPDLEQVCCQEVGPSTARYWRRGGIDSRKAKTQPCRAA